jgi:RNA polymerase sigma factor (sigma-70 family)
MISDVWVRMLEQFEKKDSIECDFSTYVINNSQWECSKSHQYGRRKVDFIFKMNRAENEIPESSLCINEDVVEKIFWTDAMNAAMKVLTQRERSILVSLYGIVGPRRTLQSVGTEHGITRERVRQIANQAIQKCQHHPTLQKYMEIQPNMDESEQCEFKEDEFDIGE